jgi:DNA replication protein DnaC
MTHTDPLPTEQVGADLARALRTLKLSAITQTLPERLALARQHHLSHHAFLEAVITDEVQRRDTTSARLRATKAGLDPTMRVETWEEPPGLTYDRALWSDLTSLRFCDTNTNVIILGPVGIGKTHLATALGHTAIRRRIPTSYYRSDKLFHRLRAARLDDTHDAEIRRLAGTGLLILDDFCLRPLDATQTNDFYEFVLERHRRHPTIWVSNREPSEWLAMTSDTLLAQSAIDRLTSGAHSLILEGPSYRQRNRAALDTTKE